MITAVAILLFLVASVDAGAQEARRIPRIGILHTIPPPATFQAFKKGLQELGYAEGQSIHLEYRWPDDGLEGLPTLAARMGESKFDVIVAISSGAASAATQAAGPIPVVFCAVGEDPVRGGMVSSLARPGGNSTGTVTLIVELEAKRLELLKEAVPGLSRVAVLWNPSGLHQRTLPDVEAAARRLNIRVIPVEWKGPGDSEPAFQLASKQRAGGVLALTSPQIMLAGEQIATVALKYRLPTAGMEAGFAEAGNLLQYGPDRTESCRRAAYYVDRILKGAKPADLPVEQATKFELIVNLKTAKALRLTIPSSVRARADRLIE
jgi:putative ABC transport system substrate-binding protein